METTTQAAVDYTNQLTAINDNLIQLNQGINQLNTMFYWFLLVGVGILIIFLFYRFLKIFI